MLFMFSVWFKFMLSWCIVSNIKLVKIQKPNLELQGFNRTSAKYDSLGHLPWVN